MILSRRTTGTVCWCGPRDLTTSSTLANAFTPLNTSTTAGSVKENEK